MKLERKGHKVVPFRLFLNRLFRYFLFSVLLITISLFIGVMGYHFIAGLSLIDSFHMSSMILTGMGPVIEMENDRSKLFSSFYALYSGVAFLSITAVFFAPIIHRLLHILQVDSDERASK
ncbi:MAG TPA: hypothetical protein PKJ62_01780 [Bacteroidia bacterium]|nr:hypothetical protein [Bacteroidia bacterium]HNS11792.1 hypothetical protein [Bacteroidia bacterium]